MALGSAVLGIGQVVFSADDRLLITGSADRTVALWDITDPAAAVLRSAITQRGRVHAVASSTGNDLLAAGGLGRVTTLWDIADWSSPVRRATLDNQRMTVEALAFSSDGNHVAVGSGYRSRLWGGGPAPVTVWDVADATAPVRRATLNSHRMSVLAVAFSPGGVLATGGADRSVILWDMSDPANPRQIASLRHDAMICSLAFSPDGRLLAVADEVAVRIWNIADTNAPFRI
ncbi:WD40 repeat domain-containing protein [Frankia tisae]|uniref:WD40 repeat domain-containing protein n=1 Tax=Frankia tisae TaxID=2950104 RepID=UPI0034D6C2BC